MSRRFHPSADRLALFLGCRLSSQEVRRIVRHLLTRCPRCVAITRAGCLTALGLPVPEENGEAPAGSRKLGPRRVLHVSTPCERGER